MYVCFRSRCQEGRVWDLFGLFHSVTFCACSLPRPIYYIFNRPRSSSAFLWIKCWCLLKELFVILSTITLLAICVLHPMLALWALSWIIRVYDYYRIDISTGVLLVPEGIIPTQYSVLWLWHVHVLLDVLLDDCRIKTMFGSSLPPTGRLSYLRYMFVWA
jgi:hypothetical protein